LRNDGGVGVDVKQLAALLDLDVRRVQQLAEQGIVKKAARGRYLLKESLHGYINFLRGTTRPATNARDEMGQVRLSILRMEEEEKALDLEVKRGGLVTLEYLEHVVRDVVAPVGQGLNNMAGILAPQVAEQPAAECFEVIDAYVEELKESLRTAFEAAVNGADEEPDGAGAGAEEGDDEDREFDE
jgi:phage terminase Nu1 subunit (DNA packaging protein)